MENTEPDIPILPGKSPWDRLPNEPIRWYARFEHYRLLGPFTRSVTKVWTDECTARDGSPPPNTRVSRGWFRQAKRWQWQKRAEAWDESNLAERSSEVELAQAHLRKALPMAAARLVELVGSESDAQARMAVNDIFKLLGITSIERGQEEGSSYRPLNIEFVGYRTINE